MSLTLSVCLQAAYARPCKQLLTMRHSTFVTRPATQLPETRRSKAHNHLVSALPRGCQYNKTIALYGPPTVLRTVQRSHYSTVLYHRAATPRARNESKLPELQKGGPTPCNTVSQRRRLRADLILVFKSFKGVIDLSQFHIFLHPP